MAMSRSIAALLLLGVAALALARTVAADSHNHTHAHSGTEELLELFDEDGDDALEDHEIEEMLEALLDDPHAREECINATELLHASDANEDDKLSGEELEHMSSEILHCMAQFTLLEKIHVKVDGKEYECSANATGGHDDHDHDRRLEEEDGHAEVEVEVGTAEWACTEEHEDEEEEDEHHLEKGLVWLYSLIATGIITLIALIGIVLLVPALPAFETYAKDVAAFAMGALLAGTLLHMLPEAVEQVGEFNVAMSITILCGFMFSYAVEQAVHLSRASIDTQQEQLRQQQQQQQQRAPLPAAPATVPVALAVADATKPTEAAPEAAAAAAPVTVAIAAVPPAAAAAQAEPAAVDASSDGGDSKVDEGAAATVTANPITATGDAEANTTTAADATDATAAPAAVAVAVVDVPIGAPVSVVDSKPGHGAATASDELVPAATAADKAEDLQPPPTPLPAMVLAPLAYTITFGDFLHNFVDGIIIGSAFMGCEESLGWSVMAAIILHEVPQELSDFVLLRNAGLSITKALLVNLLAASGAFIGCIVVVAIGTELLDAVPYFLCFGAGALLFIAATDICGPLIEENNRKRAAVRVVIIIVAMCLVGLSIIPHVHCDEHGDHDGHDH